jgi:hypothetical protein
MAAARRRVLGTGLLAAGVVVGVVIALVVLVAVIVTNIPNHEPLPGEQRCVATASGRSVAVDTEQAHYAALIAGVSVRRGLAPRAASIALATAYQESNLRNLDHGDRDSVGLFQQRPSQGWGSAEQLQNPYYATNKFYDALTRIKDWENGDITEIAQQIQISGFPDAYRDHESDARILASVLTGQSRAGIACLVRDQRPGDAAGLVAALRKTFKIKPGHSGAVVTVRASSAAKAWAYAQFAVANARGYGITTVRVGKQRWSTDQYRLTDWQPVRSGDGRTVTITVRPG